MHTKMCFNQTGDISTLNGSAQKLVDKFTYPGNSVSSTEKDIDTWLVNAWTAIDWLSVIWKLDLTDKMKSSFFQAVIVSILLYGCTTWTLTKRMEKKLDGNYTRMLRAILNKSRRQHPTKQQLYGNLPPITKTIKIRRTRHARHCWRNREKWVKHFCGPLHMDKQRQDVQLEPTHSSSVPIQDVALKTCWKQWTIGRCGERGSEISVLIAWHDDDDDDIQGPVLDFSPERGPGKGTMADVGPLIRHIVSTRLPSGGRAAFLSPLSPLYGTRPCV